MGDREVLSNVLYLLEHFPINTAASSEEPVFSANLVDFTKLIAVARGEEDPLEWVHEPCHRDYGHSAHHWSDYQAGQTPLRTTHYCNGEVEQ